MIGAGARRHFVSLETPGTPEPDGDGGYTDTVEPLNPETVFAEVKPATVRDLERIVSGTVLSTATHVVTMPYHAGVTTKTSIVFGTRRFSVTGVVNPDERNRETVCACVEVVA